jgi:hypothetical protein
MDKLLNVVYDNWVDGEARPNFENTVGPNRFRTVFGFFMFYDILDKVKECKLEEVYEIPSENFYYFINSINDVEHLIEDRNNIIPLPDNVLKCFETCANFNLVFLIEHEYESENCLLMIRGIAEKNGWDVSKIYMVNNNSKLDQYKIKHGTGLNLFALDFLVKINAKNLSEQPSQFLPNKENFFMTHNRSCKPHRFGLLCKLKREGLLDEIDWSLIMGWERKQQNETYGLDTSFYMNIFEKEEVDDYLPEITYFDTLGMKKSKYEEDHTWFDDINNHVGIDWSSTFELKTYENSYVNITTESCYFANEIHITDKSVKPLYFYQLPIFVASYQHVKMIRERFKLDVFDDIIDHSYDEVEDNKIRFKKIFEEIKRVHSNREQIIEFYKNNRERFEENRRKILELKHSNIDVNFFLSLIDKKIKRII